ncbi:MAG: NAD(P)-dependent oxidoreductase [Caldilineaceae bacterium]|nr:NAD(P)-dependent oxidoreductase [Caldilineaceae bacterium]
MTNVEENMMWEQPPTPKRVLVTGSTGAIGEPLCRYLTARGHHVRGFARRPSAFLDDYVMGDLNDQEKVRTAVQGMDVVVHLGAYPNPADFTTVLLQPNVLGPYFVLEAAVEFGVPRVVLASTVQVITGHGNLGRPVRVDDGPKPVNHYALTKAWMEQMGDMYARVHNLSVICVRIGWLPRNLDEARVLAAHPYGRDTFFSHNDSNRFHTLCVEAPAPAPGQCAILHAASKPVTVSRMDLTNARTVIGYEPEDVWPDGLPFDVDL